MLFLWFHLSEKIFFHFKRELFHAYNSLFVFKKLIIYTIYKKIPLFRMAFHHYFNKVFSYKFWKKSFPLSSVIMKAGKFLILILRTASIPISGKSTTSTERMFSFAKIAAGPPIDPK